ncbi:condensation domain-containing protein, partial [[Flexibacter] sp. ATCC 35103]|uniref:condensation domain-containing protein n=1 Tax=[Flexibacter] sp. ATCC 35103 TaxID=1937528 RepID=UPI0009D01316
AFYNLIGQKFESSHKDLSLRYVIFGGESLTPMKLKDWKSRYPQTRLINMYGITETTVFVTYKEIHDIDIELNISNIGTTIPTLSGYVLDQNQQLVPIGIIGELYVGGLGVGRGYLNKEELTRQKFIENPFAKGERLYRSGDLVRILANGDMQYEGRIDEQVKIRGFRIELGEIESVILSLPKVKEVALLVKEDALQQKSIFAYVITRSSVTVAYFRNALSSILPEYMIPSSFIELKTMPLTVNGKIDKKALYSLGTNITDTGVEYAAPTNEIEEKLVLIWQKILEKQEIGIKDNFFHLGGDSIKSIQIASRLIQEGYSINIQDIMKYPTIETLSKCVVKHTVSVNQDQIEQEINLSPIQSWFFENNTSQYSHFNQSIILKSNAPVSEEAVRAALQMIVRHHDALRIVFKKSDEGWMQENKGDESHYFFESKTINNEEYDAYCDEFQSTINLEKGPLFKAALLRKDESDYLLFACHHLVVDGVSWRIILEDFSTLYNQYLNNIELKLPLKTNSYAEWVDDLLQFSNSSVIEKQENYWLDIKSKGDFAQKLPLDKETKISRFEDTEVCSVQLNANMTDLLITKCNTVYNTSIDDVLITALSFALNDVFNITKTTLNLEGHGREPIHNNIDITRTVGWFTTLYPTYIALKHPENNINQLIEVKETLHRIPNKGVGFGILKYVLKSIKMDSPQITYNYLGTFGNEINDQKGENNFEYSNQYKGQIVSPNMIRHSLLDVSGLIANGKLTIDIGYDKNQFFEETIEKLITSYKKHLEKLVLDLSSNQEKELTPVDLTYNKLSMEQLKKLQESLFNNN